MVAARPIGTPQGLSDYPSEQVLREARGLAQRCGFTGLFEKRKKCPNGHPYSTWTWGLVIGNFAVLYVQATCGDPVCAHHDRGTMTL